MAGAHKRFPTVVDFAVNKIQLKIADIQDTINQLQEFKLDSTSTVKLIESINQAIHILRKIEGFAQEAGNALQPPILQHSIKKLKEQLPLVNSSFDIFDILEIEKVSKIVRTNLNREHNFTFLLFLKKQQEEQIKLHGGSVAPAASAETKPQSHRVAFTKSAAQMFSHEPASATHPTDEKKKSILKRKI